MKSKILIGLGLAALLASLIAHYFIYKSSTNNLIAGGVSPPLFMYSGGDYVSFDGCVLWSDQDLQPKKARQYFKINATVSQKESSCTVLDILDNGGLVSIPNPAECTAKIVDSDSKTATIAYGNVIFTVNKDRVIWTTSDPTKKGGGELIGCWDPRINWYPW